MDTLIQSQSFPVQGVLLHAIAGLAAASFYIPYKSSRRAGEYESVYDKPERQPELAELREHTKCFEEDERVLDIACGTFT